MRARAGSGLCDKNLVCYDVMQMWHGQLCNGSKWCIGRLFLMFSSPPFFAF